MADDWKLITRCGDEVTKAHQLKDLEDGTLQIEEIEDSEVRVRVYGNAATVTGRRQSNVYHNKHDASAQTRFTQLYLLRDGDWRCVSTQVTTIDPDRGC